MLNRIIRSRKSVELSDIASPAPSKAAKRALGEALKRAHRDQLEIKKEAYSLLASK